MNNEEKNILIDKITSDLQKLKEPTVVDFNDVQVIDNEGKRQPYNPLTVKPAPPIPVPQKPPKCAVIIYHRDIYKRYQKEWIDQCIASIRNQTFQDFDVLELNYGEDTTRLYEGSVFLNDKKRNFIEALNELLNIAFQDYDVVFNVNLDDYYAPDRFRLQIDEVKKGAELVSSDFTRIGNVNQDVILHDKNINEEFAKSPPHNIICHPVVCYTRSFWQKYGPYNPDSIKYEDLELWQKAVKGGANIKIIPKILCTQRVHSNNTGQTGEKY